MSAAASPFKLYPHQEDAVEAIVAALQTDDRTQAIMACGTGKTFTGQRAAERITKDNPDAITLVTVPNMVLVDQLMREWIAQVSPGFEFRAQPVVSEAASAATRAAAAERDEIVGFEMRDNTTDPEQLASFMLASGRRIIFSTYQSSDRVAEAVAIAKKTLPGFALDLIVADEAHRTAGPGTKAGAGLFKNILDDAKIEAAKRLFMTATPRQSRVPKGEKDSAAFSMGNEEVYGKRAATLSLSWAVDNGHLAPYRAFIAQVSDTDVEAILSADPKLRVSGSDSVMSAHATQIAAAIVLVKAAKQRNLGSVVTYHNSIARAQEFQTILEHVTASLPADSKPSGSLTISHINGTTPAEDRAAYLGTLESKNRKPGDWAVVTNCNCLTEGVNVPSMDAIMLVDPRSSTVGIVQAVGRPMRKDKSRPDKVASILLPVFVGEHQTVEAAIESGAFETVYDALQALKDVDDALSELFVQALEERDNETDSPERPVPNRPKQIFVPRVEVLQLSDSTNPGTAKQPSSEVDPDVPAGAGSIPLLRITDSEGFSLDGQSEDARITISAPASHGASRARELIRHSEWHQSIALRVLGDNSDWWEQGLAALRSFVAEFGHSRVTTRYVSENTGFALGRWVAKQREYFRSDRLDGDRVAALEAFPEWKWDATLNNWASFLAVLQSHAEKEGNLKIEAKFRTPSGEAVGHFLASKRHLLRAGRISRDDIAKLDAIHESWRLGRDAIVLAPWESEPGVSEQLEQAA